MIDNINKCLPFIIPESKDDFWYLQILQRKKENETLNSNSRVIKNYYIKNQQYLLDRYDEIKKLCDFFNARASLRLNKRSFEKVGFKAMINIANTMENRKFQFLPKSYDRAVGSNHNDRNKKWIIDFDENMKPQDIQSYIDFINNTEPITETKKVYCTIPSKSGFHLITSPFNTELFKRDFPTIEIHKDNPTNLYIP